MCVVLFSLGVQKSNWRENRRERETPFFCSTQKHQDLSFKFHFEKMNHHFPKKETCKTWNEHWKDLPREPVFCCFGGREIWFFPQKNHIKLWSFPFALWELSQLNFAILRKKGMSEHNTLTHTTKKSDELLWGQPFTPWEESEKQNTHFMMKFEHFSSHKNNPGEEKTPKFTKFSSFPLNPDFPSQWRTSSPQVWHSWNHDLKRFQTCLLMSTSKTNPPRTSFLRKTVSI